MMVSIFVVIVQYKTSPEVSNATVATLARATKSVDPSKLRLKVLFFDNSPVDHGSPGVFEREQYLSAPRNPGLAEAYNVGLQIAQQDGYDWLLTLDQDTVLPENFLSQLVQVTDAVGQNHAVAAIVPSIQGSGRVLSPYTFRWGFMQQCFSPGYVGLSEEPTYAVNSGTLLRVAALSQLGGYDVRFWLDASDHAIFHKLNEHGKRIYVAGDIHISHDLSILTSINEMPAARYRNMLAAESAFWDLSMNKLAGWERTLRLAVRLFQQSYHGQSELRKITSKYLWMRLVRSRQYRLRLWHREVTARLDQAYNQK